MLKPKKQTNSSYRYTTSNSKTINSPAINKLAQVDLKKMNIYSVKKNILSAEKLCQSLQTLD